MPRRSAANHGIASMGLDLGHLGRASNLRRPASSLTPICCEREEVGEGVTVDRSEGCWIRRRAEHEARERPVAQHLFQRVEDRARRRAIAPAASRAGRRVREERQAEHRRAGARALAAGERIGIAVASKARARAHHRARRQSSRSCRAHGSAELATRVAHLPERDRVAQRQGRHEAEGAGQQRQVKRRRSTRVEA